MFIEWLGKSSNIYVVYLQVHFLARPIKALSVISYPIWHRAFTLTDSDECFKLKVDLHFDLIWEHYLGCGHMSTTFTLKHHKFYPSGNQTGKRI